MAARISNPKTVARRLAGLDPRACLKPADVAGLLNCTVDHIYDLAEEGRLKAILISGGNNLTTRRCLRIPVEALTAFMESNQTTP